MLYVLIKPMKNKFWRWRFYMAERIAERMDLDYYGVQGIYVFGSTNNGSAGPGSDFDLLVHLRQPAAT
jgi:predicted nucleotidyltransferase